MIRKFATVSRSRVALTLIAVTILVGTATVHAQHTPAEPTPPAQQQQKNPQSSSQQTPPEEIGPSRKPKVKDYKNWVFNVGGGASLTNGNTKNLWRGGGGIGAAGVARNYSKYFGVRLDFQFDNLPLRTSALQQAQATSATSQVYSLALDPIINIPVTNGGGGY